MMEQTSTLPPGSRFERRLARKSAIAMGLAACSDGLAFTQAMERAKAFAAYAEQSPDHDSALGLAFTSAIPGATTGEIIANAEAIRACLAEPAPPEASGSLSGEIPAPL